MADKTLTVRDGYDTLAHYKVVLADNGDGTYSPLVKLGTTPTIDIGDVTLLAGEAHVGAVGGHTVTPSFTPVLTVAGAYVAGDYVGTSASTTAITAARVNAGSGWVISARLIDYALQSIAMECWLFNAAITPPADNAPWTITDADMLKLVCIIPFSTPYANAQNCAFIGAPIAPAAFVCPAGVKTLFPYLVTRGTPTYASLDLTVIFSISQD